MISDLDPFAVVGLRLPEVIDRAGLDFVPTADDLLAFSPRLDGQVPMRDRTISPSHIVRIAFRLNRPVATVVADLKRFAPLGVEMPEVDLSRVGDLTVTREDSVAMSQGRRTWGLAIGDKVPPAHLFLVSSELDKTLANTYHRLSRFRCLGLELPDVDLEEAGSISKMNWEDVVALSHNCDGEWPWIDGVVTREHVLRAAKAIYESPVETVERLRSFECLGLRIPSGHLESWDQ